MMKAGTMGLICIACSPRVLSNSDYFGLRPALFLPWILPAQVPAPWPGQQTQPAAVSENMLAQVSCRAMNCSSRAGSVRPLLPLAARMGPRCRWASGKSKPGTRMLWISLTLVLIVIDILPLIFVLQIFIFLQLILVIIEQGLLVIIPPPA